MSKNDRLNRKGILMTWEQRQVIAQSRKTYETIKRPFSTAFAFWAGKNGKQLRQTERFDEQSANAYAVGVGWRILDDAEKEIENE